MQKCCFSEEVKKLRAELEDAHALLDVQREKYEREKELEAERNRFLNIRNSKAFLKSFYYYSVLGENVCLWI